MADVETSGVAERYASALFELAQESNALNDVEDGVATMRALIAESDDLMRLIENPLFGADDQIRALGAVMDRAEVTGLTANFMKLLAKNRRLFAAPGILKRFEEMMAEHRGEVIAVVTSAEPLSSSHVAALKEILADKAGGTVKLEQHVDPTLIGGLIVRLGSKMIDTSVRTRLEGLRNAMKEAA